MKMIPKPMKTLSGKRLWGIWIRRRIRQFTFRPEFDHYLCSNCGYNPRVDSLMKIKHCASCGKDQLEAKPDGN